MKLGKFEIGLIFFLIGVMIGVAISILIVLD